MPSGTVRGSLWLVPRRPPGAATPASGRGREDLGGFKRRWRDTRTIVGTTFRRRSRVFLVGELSKFPLPYNSWEGEWFASIAPGALALCRQRYPRTYPGTLVPDGKTSSEEPRAGALERCRGRLGSWLHKHPHPSTCPRLPARWLPPLLLADMGTRVPQLVSPFACYPQSKLNVRDRRR
ncbi:LOW QUALITY PROTEIN: killin [Molossus nigricans]